MIILRSNAPDIHVSTVCYLYTMIVHFVWDQNKAFCYFGPQHNRREHKTTFEVSGYADGKSFFVLLNCKKGSASSITIKSFDYVNSSKWGSSYSDLFDVYSHFGAFNIEHLYSASTAMKAV